MTLSNNFSKAFAAAALTAIFATGCASTDPNAAAYNQTATNVTNATIVSVANTVAKGGSTADLKQAAITGAVNGLLTPAQAQAQQTTTPSNTTQATTTK